jgi:hypothetical protein
MTAPISLASEAKSLRRLAAWALGLATEEVGSESQNQEFIFNFNRIGRT